MTDIAHNRKFFELFDLGPKTEVYSIELPQKDGRRKIVTLNISALKAEFYEPVMVMAAMGGVRSPGFYLASVSLEKEFADKLMTNGAVEAHRLDAVNGQDPMYLDALLYIENHDGAYCVDGLHRYTSLQRRGEKFAHAIVFQPHVWQRFLLSDAVTRSLGDAMEEILQSPSGI